MEGERDGRRWSGERGEGGRRTIHMYDSFTAEVYHKSVLTLP